MTQPFIVNIEAETSTTLHSITIYMGLVGQPNIYSLAKNYSTSPWIPIDTWWGQEGISEPNTRVLVLNHQVLKAPEAKTLS